MDIINFRPANSIFGVEMNKGIGCYVAQCRLGKINALALLVYCRRRRLAACDGRENIFPMAESVLGQQITKNS